MCTPTPTTSALVHALLLSPHGPSSPSTSPHTALPIDTRLVHPHPDPPAALRTPRPVPSLHRLTSQT
ncbi:hypothetical protein RTBOTA2_005396 [Rhodotorula toruloides]|nr:hypothetical protein RTBOTA2_005396 [Rhodotorula toruloides]